MKNVFVLALVSFIMISATACRKNMDSNAERVWHRIEEVVQKEGIERLYPTTTPIGWNTTVTFIGDWGSKYSFNDPFLTIGTANYNLERLVTYEVMMLGGYKCLVLYF